MTLRKGRNPEEPLSDQERSKARGLIGALQWPAGQGMPALAASVSVQAGDLAGGDGKVLQELNKTLRFAKSIAHHKMSYLAKPETKNDKTLDSLAIVLYVDAAFSVRKDHGSQGGFVILAGDKKVLTGQKTPMSTLSWRSFKLEPSLPKQFSSRVPGLGNWFGRAAIGEELPDAPAVPSTWTSRSTKASC